MNTYDSLYWKYVNEVRVLSRPTKEEELVLFQTMERAKQEQKRFHPDPALLAAGEKARYKLILGNLRLVIILANRMQFSSSTLTKLDLVQEGNIGLIHAVDGFNHQSGFQFSSYAGRCIENAIAALVRKYDIHRSSTRVSMVVPFSVYDAEWIATLQRDMDEHDLTLANWLYEDDIAPILCHNMVLQEIGKQVLNALEPQEYDLLLDLLQSGLSEREYRQQRGLSKKRFYKIKRQYQAKARHVIEMTGLTLAELLG